MSIYPSPDVFLQTARDHQRRWIKRFLVCDSDHKKQVIIPAKLAQSGKIFFDDTVKTSVTERYPKAFDLNKKGKTKAMVSNALRSQHIPFNFFAPLKPFLGSDSLASLFSELAGFEISSIDKLGFEQPRGRKNNPLKDNTAFDAYLEGTQGNARLIIGVEVKYTEGSYGWGDAEKDRTKEESDYVARTKGSSAFKEGALAQISNKYLEQIWRNFLLGLALAEEKKCKFHFIHLYPQGNVYQEAVCREFFETLTPSGRLLFSPVTYEQFLTVAASTLPDETASWLSYLNKRYICE